MWTIPLDDQLINGIQNDDLVNPLRLAVLAASPFCFAKRGGISVGYANGDILLGVSWWLIRSHAARSSFSWMDAHSMTRP